MTVGAAGTVTGAGRRWWRALRRPRISAAVGLALAAALAGAGDAAAPSTAPQLRVETGAHGARINRIAIDPFEPRLITVADDKTVRLWAHSDARPLATLRIPVGDGAEGRLHAVAVSPSGKSIAVGGFTGLTWSGHADVYLFDRQSGEWRGRVSLGSEAAAAIHDLAFLPDGRLAVALDDAKGVRVVDFAKRTVSIVDGDYADAIVALAVAADGRLATASLDGGIRLYDQALKRTALHRLPGGQTAHGLAFSPDAQRLAAGLLGGAEPRAVVLSTDQLKPVFEVKGASGRRGWLAVVAWSQDGATLYAAGGYGDGDGLRLIRRTAVDGGAGADLSIGRRDIVTDIKALSDGGLAYATADPALGVLGPDGQPRGLREPRQADFRDGYEACFAYSAAGDVVAFGLKRGGADCVRFDVQASQLDRRPTARADLGRPLQSAAGVTVTDWRNQPRPKINGQPVILEANELARSAAVVPDGSAVAIGTDFAVALYRGGQRVWREPVASPAWMVGATADRRYVIAGLGDGTIRWYEAANGAPALSLLALPYADTWLLWTPEGLFDHGPGGESLIGYHRNRVEDGQIKGADFIAVGQLYSRFFRRDLVKQRFLGAGKAAIADYLQRVGDAGVILDTGLPPSLRVVEACVEGDGAWQCRPVEGAMLRGTRAARPIPEETAAAPAIVLRIEAEDRGGGFGEIKVMRNDVLVPSARTTRAVAVPGRTRNEEVLVQLAPGRNDITLIAENERGVIQSAPDEQPRLSVTHQRAQAPSKPTLRMIAIGINRFANAQLDRDNALKFAVADAVGVAEMMRSDRSGQVYGDVDAIVLTDAEATLAGIRTAFRALAARTRPEDVALVFLAGHGVNLDGKYHFLPYDLRDLTASGLRATALTHDEFATLLRGFDATRMLVAIDTCYAGAFGVDDTITAGKHLNHASGRVVLAGSTSQQQALDGIAGHGVFTGVLLEALRGDADLDNNREIDIFEVTKYTLTRVPEAVRRISQNHPQQARFHGEVSDPFALRGRLSER